MERDPFSPFGPEEPKKPEKKLPEKEPDFFDFGEGQKAEKPKRPKVERKKEPKKPKQGVESEPEKNAAKDNKAKSLSEFLFGTKPPEQPSPEAPPKPQIPEVKAPDLGLEDMPHNFQVEEAVRILHTNKDVIDLAENAIANEPSTAKERISTKPLEKEVGNLKDASEDLEDEVEKAEELATAEQSQEEEEPKTAEGSPETEDETETETEPKDAEHESKEPTTTDTGTGPEAATTDTESGSAPDSSSGASGGIDGGDTKPLPESLTRTTAPSLEAAVERANQKVEKLKKAIESKSKKEKKEESVLSNVISVMLGVTTVGAAFAEVNRPGGFFMHSPQSREYRELREAQKEQIILQKRQLEQQREQNADLLRLRERQGETMGRTDRRGYYREIGNLAHKQADITRETTAELRQANKPQETQIERLARQQREIDFEAAHHRRVKENEVWQRPVVTVENSDQVEASGNNTTATRFGKTPHQGLTGNGAVEQQNLSGHSGQETTSANSTTLPSTVRAQAELKVRQAKRIQSAWLFSVLLLLTIIGIVITFALAG